MSVSERPDQEHIQADLHETEGPTSLPVPTLETSQDGAGRLAVVREVWESTIEEWKTADKIGHGIWKDSVPMTLEGNTVVLQVPQSRRLLVEQPNLWAKVATAFRERLDMTVRAVVAS